MQSNWRRVVVGALAALAATVVFAQDFNQLKGDAARTGRNAQPALMNPGIAGLGWWRPNALDPSASQAVVDNLDAGFTASTGAWSAVTQIGEWAESPYVPDDNAPPATNPAYRYAFSTASNSFLQPEVPANAAQHATWTFRFDPANIGNAPRNFALFVWLPIGPTYPGLGPAKFPSRKFVYEVFYGNNRREIQIVDTYNAGFGWVRLGNGGAATSRLYDYDGVNPIRIVLHNTVVRNVFEQLEENVDPFVQANNPIVYADAAMAVSQNGSYQASPIVGDVNPLGVADIRAVGAFNEYSVAFRNNLPETIVKGVVTSYNHDGTPGIDAPNNTRWRYSPLEEDSQLTVYQDDAGAGFTAGPGWTARNVPPGIFRGVGFHDSDVTDQVVLTQQCEWTPTLDDGVYEIWAWVPGSVPGLTLSRDVTYEIEEPFGVVTTVQVNQENARGWVRLGTRRFTHDIANGGIQVRVLNFGPASELGRKVYADQLRFLGATDTSITSTPIQTMARVNVPPLGGLIDRSVVIVAAENGKLYCLDAVGNSDGTTNVFWTYPSTPDPDNPSWTDPNHVATEDGVGGIAEMPTGFNLSSATIGRIGGEDYLYISANNGRVYCIAMAGRGDMDLATRKPGTTTRRWSYPNDYPVQSRPGTLGPSFGSVAFSTASGQPRIYVPTSQGRLYVLDASGNPGNKTTNVEWTYPNLNSPTYGPCEMTPVVDFNHVYVGFRTAPGEDRGRFFALNLTGTVDWEFNGTTLWGGGNFVNADDWVSSPAAIPATEFGAQANTIVAANDNRWITAFDAATGAVLWTTNETGSPVLGGLTYTPMNVYDAGGGLSVEPIVLVPTADGRFQGLFAETVTTNVFGGTNRLAWGWITSASGMETTMAAGRNWLYGADPNGMLYAFHDGGSVIGGAGSAPGQNQIVPNNPQSIPYRDAKIKFITKAAYERLRLPEGDPQQLTYAQATSAANAVNRSAFEWGETVYALVYDFPGEVDVNPDPNDRTQVEFRFSAEGTAVRNLTVRAKLFPIIAAGNPPTEPVSGERLDGFAVLSYTLQGSGTNALPPGNGEAAFGVSAQLQQNGPFQSVAVNPANARRPFTIANPIGIAVQFNNAVQPPAPLANYSLGYTPDPSNPEAMTNGSPDITGTAKLENRILSTVGLAQHNATKSSTWAVYDRSLMTLIRGPGRGLDLIRVERSDLAWQGGSAAIYKPINLVNYPNFEDRPDQFPNISLDYPNIKREQFLIIKDKFGQAENPTVSAVSLVPPTNVDVNNPLTRVLQPTIMDFELNVPRFQPPNLTNVPDSSGGNVSSGYYGGLVVFVDGSGNGSFDRRGRREAHRTMWLGGSVAVDERIAVNDTELDLGSEPQGAGFDPIAPWVGGTSYSPWGGGYQSMFHSFQVLNQGNTNMLSLRVAKAYDYDGPLFSWGLYAPANNDRSWIDTQYNLWSDIDETFALNHMGGSNTVLLQKARVGDRSPTELLTNPIRRDNFNLGVSSGPLLPAPAPARPRLSVTVPIGTPVGTYLTDIFVIEDVDGNESLQYVAGSNERPAEVHTEPTLRLRFNVRETRLTNGFTRLAAPMIHGSVTGNEPFLHQNTQPTGMRDLNGQLVVAFASNAANWGQPQPTEASTNDLWRIYLASIDGMSQTAGGVVGTNPLRDLNSWNWAGPRWFQQAPAILPNLPPNDPLIFGAAVIGSTAKFGSPAFAPLGGINPFNTSQVANPMIAYVGEAQLQQNFGREIASKIFLNQIQVDATGAITIGGGTVSTSDLLTLQKSKPAIVQVNNQAAIYFTTTSVGQSNLYFAHYNGAAMSASTKLDLGTGFESVGSVSAVGRIYEGIARPTDGLNTGDPITELAFTGKLRGRANREVFLARLRTGNSGRPLNVPGARSPFLSWGPQTESLVPDPNNQTFRTIGASWYLNQLIDIVRDNPASPGTDQSILVANTKKIDQETGIVTADLYSGGQVYIDTTQGIVRFTGFRPNVAQNIRIKYTPRFLRLSTVNTASYSGPSLVWDNRFTGEFDYYALPGGGNPNGAQIPADRFTVSFGRAAAGSGQTSRPYMATLRYGHQLTVNGRPVALHTQPNGVVTNLTFSTPPTGPYQVDPASGRFYVTNADEGRPIVVSSFTYVDERTGAPVVYNAAQEATPRLIVERAESPVPIESAVNESMMFSFLDPFDNAAPADRRPGLIWMVWASTRGGSPDVYMQTIAPKYTPRPVSRTGN